MTFDEIPAAMSYQTPICRCGYPLPWPADIHAHPTTPVLLVCAACRSVWRAVYQVPMVVPPLDAPASRDPGSDRPMHPSHDYDIVSNACRHCGRLLTFQHMGPVNPVWYEPCRGASILNRADDCRHQVTDAIRSTCALCGPPQ